MRPRRVNFAALLLLLAGVACNELPDAPQFNERVATVRFVDTETAIAVGTAVAFEAEARNADGLVIPRPALVWTSNNTGAATVAGSGTTALVTGRGVGNATIRATSTEGVRAEVLVRVLQGGK